MGLEVLDQTVELSSQSFEEVVADKESPVRVDTDARRRLEDKLEEMRLRRELRDYNFDV